MTLVICSGNNVLDETKPKIVFSATTRESTLKQLFIMMLNEFLFFSIDISYHL